MLVCLTNEPPEKRRVIGGGTTYPAAVAVVLARLIDEAPPASRTVAAECSKYADLLAVRFGYPGQARTALVSIACAGGHVVYVDNRGYLLPALLANYLLGSTGPGGTLVTPELIGQPLAKAVATARRSGYTVFLAGEIVDRTTAGSVLLQEPTLDHQITVIAGVPISPPCRASQLAIQYLPGGAGAGNDFGRILLRNTSPSWCQLNGPATITGRTGGHAVTPSLTAKGVNDLELSPKAAAAVPGHMLSAAQLVASEELSAEYRDQSDGMCQAQVVPASWRLDLTSGTLVVPNGPGTDDAGSPGSGGLITCRGHFDVSPMGLAIS